MSIHLVLGSASPARWQTLQNAGLHPTRWVSDTDEETITGALWPGHQPEQVVTTLARAKARAVVGDLKNSWLQYQLAVASSEKTPPADLPPEHSNHPLITAAKPGDQIVVLGADSMLLLEGNLQGKPHTAARARAQIDRLANNSPVLYSGHCVHVFTLPDLSPTQNTSTAIETWVKSTITDPLLPEVNLTPTSGSPAAKYLSLGPVINHPETKESQILGCSQATVHFGDITAQEADAYVATGEPLKVAGGFTIDSLGSAFIDGISGDYHGIVGISLPLLHRLTKKLGISWPDLWEK